MTDIDQTSLSDMLCQLVRVIAPQPPETVRPSDRLVGDLGFHSLALVEMSFTLEEVFSLDEMAIEDAARVERIEDIVELIHTMLVAGQGQLPSDEELTRLAARYGAKWEPVS